MTSRTGESFYGWRVVGAAFVLAVFGWGLGFYGPPIYLHAVREARGFTFIAAAGSNVPLLILGVALFGSGIGNATSLPPLIAQVEFVKDDVARVVPLIVAIAQATFAFAPVVFGLIREFAPHASPGAAPALFIAAALIQALAITAFLIGRR